MDKTENSSEIIQCFEFEDQNTIWIGTITGGLLKKTRSSKEVRFLTSDSKIGDYTLWSIGISPEGTILASASTGIVSFNRESWTSYGTGNSNYFKAVSSDYAFGKNGETWFATTRGLGKILGSDTSIFTTKNSNLPVNGINGVDIDSSGTLWLATNAGPIRFQQGTFTLLLPESKIGIDWRTNCVSTAPGGKICFGFDKMGVGCYDGNSWKIYNRENGDIIALKILSIAIDNNGNPWIGTE